LNKPNSESPYRWYILILAALTNTLASAVPSMCLPVLFKDISRDLNLSLVEVGLIWGIAALPGIFTSLAGGAIGDRFGPKRILTAGCLLVGIVGGLRGLANNFTGLAAAVFLVGFLTPFVGMNVIKTCGIWFSSRQLVLANGVLSLGMALGFVIALLRRLPIPRKIVIAKQLRRTIWPLLGTAVVPPINAVYPLAEAAEAHRHIESSRHIGKIMLSVRDA
jgi:MFS family permease